jgi:Fur family transcriptional regulator, ferric uptake regulator
VLVGNGGIRRDTGHMPGADMTSDLVVTQARSILQHHRLRCTAPRVAVMTVLMADPAVGHLSAQQIVERLAERGDLVDLTTVYRTLTTMVEVGILHALTVGDRVSTYGLAEQPHHHAVCTRCDAVIEVPAEFLAEALARASDGSRFVLPATAGLTLHGLCPTCQEQVE